MPDRLSPKYAGVAFFFAASLCLSSPASAGFQWIAPSDAASAPPMGMPQESVPAVPFMAPAPMVAPAPFVAPAPQAAPEILSPLVITGGVESPQVSRPADSGIVQGFAKSVPLAVALRQILPPGYAFSIDPDVDMGTLVSFQGGRPWRDTLHDSLAPAGLVMREQGQMVAVGFAHAGLVVLENRHFVTGMGPKNLVMVEPAPVPGPVVPMPVPMDNAVITPIPDEAIKLEPSLPAGAVATESWSAERGQYLRKILEDWSRRANVEFDWLSEYDYPLQASVSFSGGFEGAVRSLLTGFEGARPQPIAELHSNPNIGQMVLVVRTRGNTNSD